MTPAPFTSALTAPLFGDAEASALLSDDAFIGHMVAVESALVLACAKVGLVGQDAARLVQDHLAKAQVPPEALGKGMASAGVPVPALVAALRAELGADGSALHWGATSQDIVDCAHVLQWRDVLHLQENRLLRLLDMLHRASDAHAATLMAGRTRSQIATPITLGLRVATWAQPLIALEAEIPELRAHLLRVQFGGASGAASAVGDRAHALTDALAEALDLHTAPAWHGDRTGPQRLGAWLVRLSAALGKMARDLIVSGRSEIAEMRAGSGGGSSTMPQKSNPVSAEALVTLAQYSASLQPLLAQAAQPLEERDGAVWALEWLALPQMAVCASAGLRHATELFDSFVADATRMAARLDAGNGSIMAETASFALARHMSRAEATAHVTRALGQARTQDQTLAEVLRLDPELGKLEDWADCLNPLRVLPAAEAMRERILRQRARSR